MKKAIILWLAMLACSSVLYLGNFCAGEEYRLWDCPGCGRTGITKNYCGSCAHPAPWIEEVTGKLSRDEFSKVGNIVGFGHYEQDNNLNNGPEEIEWIVLDVQNGKNLLISRFGLDAKVHAGTWEHSSLRTWLNDVFMYRAFNKEEQLAILTTLVDNSSSQGYSGWDTPGGNNTKDKLFLLSYAEANKYLNVTKNANKNATVMPTLSAYKGGAAINFSYGTADNAAPGWWSAGAGWWWLRSPGRSYSNAACVYYDGSLASRNTANDDACVRPTFWLNLGADIFK